MTAPTLDLSVTCPPWCAGDCHDWTDDGGQHHASGFTDVKAHSHADGPVCLSVSATRVERVGQEPALSVDLLIGPAGRISMDDLTLTPQEARQLAAALLEAADNADSGGAR